jgi:hypothetical protein
MHVFHYDTLWSGKCVPAFQGLQFPSLSTLSGIKGINHSVILVFGNEVRIQIFGPQDKKSLDTGEVEKLLNEEVYRFCPNSFSVSF